MMTARYRRGIKIVLKFNGLHKKYNIYLRAVEDNIICTRIIIFRRKNAD